MHTHTRLLFAAVLALCAGPVLAADEAPYGASLPPGVVLEGSVETTTDAVIFPADAGGRLQVRACEGCTHSTIAVDANTTYVVGGDKLGLKDMAQYVLRTPGHALTIHYRLKDTVATRVTVLVR